MIKYMTQHQAKWWDRGWTWAGLLCALTIIAFVIFLFNSNDSQSQASNLAVASTETHSVPKRSAIAPRAFYVPESAATPDLPDYIVQRKKKMIGLMTGSPSYYYTMKLSELRDLAKQGDADAMMQLAEQYASEDSRLRADPDYPVGENPRLLARQYLTAAFELGRIRAAALVSKQLFEDNQPVEAYAWRLVSEKVGDSINPVWGNDTNQFAGLTDREKQEAEIKATVVVGALLKNKMH